MGERDKRMDFANLLNLSDFINTLLGVLVGAFLAYRINRYFEGKRQEKENLSLRAQSYLTFIDYMHNINLKYRGNDYKDKRFLDDEDIKNLSININKVMIYASDDVIKSVLIFRFAEMMENRGKIDDYLSYEAQQKPITRETLKDVNEIIFKAVSKEIKNFWQTLDVNKK